MRFDKCLGRVKDIQLSWSDIIKEDKSFIVDKGLAHLLLNTYKKSIRFAPNTNKSILVDEESYIRLVESPMNFVTKFGIVIDNGALRPIAIHITSDKNGRLFHGRLFKGYATVAYMWLKQFTPYEEGIFDWSLGPKELFFTINKLEEFKNVNHDLTRDYNFVIYNQQFYSPYKLDKYYILYHCSLYKIIYKALKLQDYHLSVYVKKMVDFIKKNPGY